MSTLRVMGLSIPDECELIKLKAYQIANAGEALDYYSSSPIIADYDLIMAQKSLREALKSIDAVIAKRKLRDRIGGEHLKRIA